MERIGSTEIHPSKSTRFFRAWRPFLCTLLLLVLLLVTGCTTVPFSNRSRFLLYPSGSPSLMAKSKTLYGEMLAKHPVCKDQHQVERVRRVGKRLEKEVVEICSRPPYNQDFSNFEWTYNVIETDKVNAWCLPGGRIGIYTGMLKKIGSDDDMLAVVMAHEIAHAVAEHGLERMSQQFLINVAAALVIDAVEDESVWEQILWKKAFGIGVALGYILPYSRVHEKEADYLGLVFMHLAGYDLNAAVRFWDGMGPTKAHPIVEYFSTHPLNETRVRDIRAAIPDIRNRRYLPTAE